MSLYFTFDHVFFIQIQIGNANEFCSRRTIHRDLSTQRSKIFERTQLTKLSTFCVCHLSSLLSICVSASHFNSCARSSQVQRTLSREIICVDTPTSGSVRVAHHVDSNVHSSDLKHPHDIFFLSTARRSYDFVPVSS